jgi:hypothetical protein
MGFDDDGDPPAGRTEEAEDTGDDRMDFEETTEEFVRNLEKSAASLLQKEAARTSTSTSATTTATTTTTTGMKKTDEEDEGDEDYKLEKNQPIICHRTGWRKWRQY